MFYTSKALLDAETRYPKIEKLILALVVAARKLRPYFQAHTVIVMTQYPLRSILHGPDASQRVMKWALELGQYGLVFRPRTAIKAQALADFIAEFAPGPSIAANEPDDVPKAAETPTLPVSLNSYKWHLHVDGASNHKGSGAGVVLVTPDGSLLEQAITLGFKASNNEVEYEALLAGLRMTKDLAVKKLAIYSDSQLITSQTAGEYMAKHPRIAQYLEKVREQLKAFQTYTLTQVPRSENAHADALAGLGSALDHQLKRSIPVEYLDKPSIEFEPVAEVTQVSATPSWQSPIIDYLVNSTLPAERLESRKLQTRAARYYMWKDILVRRSYIGPHLRCVAAPDDLKVLSSIHKGVCGNHSGGRSLAQKALNASYYWPTMHQDAHELVQKCECCQRYKPVPARQRATSTSKSLAVHAMGDRPGWAHAARCWGQRNDDRGNRLFHQVDRSGTHDDDNSNRRRMLHMEEHHLPFWYPSIHRHRQRPAVCRQRLGGILPKIRYKATYVYTKVSARQ